MKNRVVVIGGSGFLGLNLCKYLVDCGYSIINCDQRSPRMFQENVSFVSIREWSDLETIIQENDCVVDLAFKGVPNSPNENWYEDAENNILGTLKLIHICTEKKAEKIVFASSGGAVYGAPQYIPIDEAHPAMPASAYGIQKLAIEHYLRLVQKRYGIQTTCLRISNLYGPGQIPFTGQGVIATFLANGILDRPVEIWGTGEEQRDYVFVGDVVKSFERVLRYSGRELIFNVGSGYGVTLNELVLLIEKVLKKQIHKIYLPQSCSEVGVNFLDCTKAHEILLWKPQIDLREGIKEMLSTWAPEEQVFRARL